MSAQDWRDGFQRGLWVANRRVLPSTPATREVIVQTELAHSRRLHDWLDAFVIGSGWHLSTQGPLTTFTFEHEHYAESFKARWTTVLTQHKVDWILANAEGPWTVVDGRVKFDLDTDQAMFVLKFEGAA